MEACSCQTWKMNCTYATTQDMPQLSMTLGFGANSFRTISQPRTHFNLWRQCQRVLNGQWMHEIAMSALPTSTTSPNLNPPKKPNFRAGTVMDWKDLHVLHANTPQKIDAPLVDSSYQVRVLDLQTKLDKLQQGFTYWWTWIQTRKVRNTTKSCHVVRGKSHTQSQT